MKLEILLSCMHQENDALVRKSHITGDVVIINQCENNDYKEYDTHNGKARIFFTTQRGLTRSRNMAIQKASGDICLICDDDEVFVQDYEKVILQSYEKLDDADVIIFKMKNRPSSFKDQIQRIRFPQTMKVSSWQISFRRRALLEKKIKFDELLGAGTGNGAEEELKLLLDCERAGLKIYYVPAEIASVGQEESTWFRGYTEQFFYNRGATTRYILGGWLSFLYAVYYVLRKKKLYSKDIAPSEALRATFRGIKENKIGKQAKYK